MKYYERFKVKATVIKPYEKNKRVDCLSYLFLAVSAVYFAVHFFVR